MVIPPQCTAEIVFKVEKTSNPGLTEHDAVATIIGNRAKILIPSKEDHKVFAVSFTVATGATVKVNGVIQESGITKNDFSSPVIYTLTTANGTVKTYVLTILDFTGLPIFYLTTAGPVLSKDIYVNGNLVINPNVLAVQEIRNIDLQIKGRGNSTWDMPKKPYRLKFGAKTAMFGLPAAKNWVLLANYADKTLMRNYIADFVGQQVQADFTPHGIFVELVMNGEYVGTYMLTEQVEVDPNRVNIKDLKPANTSAADITGGYLLELDQRLGEVYWFPTTRALPMNIKSPDAITPAQMAYISGYVQQTEDAIFSADFGDPNKGYAKYINVDSFIKWFLVSELFKNQDSKNFSSMLYYKDRNGKLGMGPLWDFDLAAGNVNYSDATNPTGWWVKDGVWFSRLFQDPVFYAKVKAAWADLKAKGIPAMFTTIDSTQDYLTPSALQNFQRWDILGIYVWPNPVVLGNYPSEVEHFKNWLKTRVTWIDANL
ncbi:CotH kinase family protein [soil metagenome]